MNLRAIQKVEAIYVKVASNSFGFTDEQLILSLAPRLSKHIKEVPPLNWRPAVEQLLEEESVNQLLLKLLSAMKKKHGHKKALLITYFITGEGTLTSVNLNVVLHGMTISK